MLVKEKLVEFLRLLEKVGSRIDWDKFEVSKRFLDRIYFEVIIEDILKCHDKES